MEFLYRYYWGNIQLLIDRYTFPTFTFLLKDSESITKQKSTETLKTNNIYSSMDFLDPAFTSSNVMHFHYEVFIDNKVAVQQVSKTGSCTYMAVLSGDPYLGSGGFLHYTTIVL